MTTQAISTIANSVSSRAPLAPTFPTSAAMDLPTVCSIATLPQTEVNGPATTLSDFLALQGSLDGPPGWVEYSLPLGYGW